MKMTIQTKEENKLLGRTRLSCQVVFEGKTPNKQELHSQLAKQLGADPQLLVLKAHGTYGTREVQFVGYLYETLALKNVYEGESASGKPAQGSKEEAVEGKSTS